MSTPRNPLLEVASWASEPPRIEVVADVNGSGFNLESFIARHLVVSRVFQWRDALVNVKPGMLDSVH